ncbi:uncharacterized protein LOC117112236 [Anneissia japonica]|uniref:uncharacterized protein LOC117112236 n=1 Tax=Anneissia japonica TaxID=1529436 RepID=UPI001425ACBC|nr:uncharacterized protein LOC117112236 [Anneissia japonica]
MDQPQHEGSTNTPANPTPKPVSLSWEPSAVPKMETQVPNVSEQASELTYAIHQMLKDSKLHQLSLVEALQLPKNELPVFDGDPLKYWSFIRAFDNTVDKKTTDDGAKLMSRIQFCTGKAKKLLQCCLIKEPSDGYLLAKKLLKERFGNNDTIAQAWIDKIVKQPDVKSSLDLQDFADELRGCQETLESMGFLSEMENRRSLCQIAEKLPNYLKTRWLKKNHNIKFEKNRNPRLDDLILFITSAAREANDPIFGKLIQKEKHTITHDHDQREALLLAYVRSKALCVNCFKPGHYGKDCTRPFTCTIDGCGQKHSKFLHIPRHQEDDRGNPITTSTVPQTSQQKLPPVFVPSSTIKSNFIHVQNKKVALPIVAVRVRGNDQQTFVDTYALVDPGGTASYCTDELAKTLSKQSKLLINTESVNLNLSNLQDTYHTFMPQVTIRPSLNLDAENLACREELSRWPHLNDIELPVLNNSKVQLLIRQDMPDLLCPHEVRRGNPGEPFGVWTVLGWAINGPIGGWNCQSQSSHYVQSKTNFDNLWWSESTEETVMSFSDRRVISKWNDSTVLEKDGHYTMNIPFKNNPPNLPDNRQIVNHRLHLLGKHMTKDAALKERYTAEVHKLLDAGYAELVPDN